MTIKVGGETIICINVYEWVKNKTELEKHFFHFANEGKRGWVNADLLKRTGFKAGVLDIFMSKGNGDHSGLWIEVKDKGKKPTQVQKDFMKQMNDDGYYATWFDNFEDIIHCIKWFYSLS